MDRTSPLNTLEQIGSVAKSSIREDVLASLAPFFARVTRSLIVLRAFFFSLATLTAAIVSSSVGSSAICLAINSRAGNAHTHSDCTEAKGHLLSPFSCVNDALAHDTFGRTGLLVVGF